MAEAVDHIRLVRHNQDLIDQLLPNIDQFSDWVAVVAFYKALHVVETVFFELGLGHRSTHSERATTLRRDKRFTHIRRHYVPLWIASSVARYLTNPETGDEFPTFGDYLTPGEVRTQLLDHHLRQVVASAERLIGTNPFTAPPPPPTTTP